MKTFILGLLLLCQTALAGPPILWGSPYPLLLSGGVRIRTSDTTTTCNAAAAGGIRYNAGTFEGCNGSAWSSFGGAGGGATRALDNLTGVAINTSLISDTDQTDNLGSVAVNWLGVYSGTVYTPSITTGAAGTNFSLATPNNGAGNSGNIAFSIGSASGTQGTFQFLKTGVAPVIGDVWTASSTAGVGYWATPSSLSAVANQYGVLLSGAANVASVLAPDASTSKYLKSAGAAANPAWSAITLDQIGGAAGAVSWTQGANAITASADTIGSGNAEAFSTSHTTFTGSLFKGTSTGNNTGSTGAIFSAVSTGTSNRAKGLLITSASTESVARGIDVSMTGAGDTTGIALTSGNSASSVGFAISRSGNAGSTNYNTISDGSINSATGLLVNMTGTTGNQGAANFISGSNGAPVVANFGANGTTNTGTALNVHNASTSGGQAADIDVTIAGSGNGIRLYNKGTASNNNGFALNFHANQTGTNDRNYARIAGALTDITAGSADGILTFWTIFNNTIAERFRIDNAGHLIMVTASTAPSITANCGTTPSVAGTDVAGRITVGSGGTDNSCTLTFGNAFVTAPACTVGDETTSLLLKGVATTTTLIVSVATAFGAGDKVVYHCIGY